MADKKDYKPSFNLNGANRTKNKDYITISLKRGKDQNVEYDSVIVKLDENTKIAKDDKGIEYLYVKVRIFERKEKDDKTEVDDGKLPF